MTLMLADRNVAILAANGFDETQLTEIQRALIKVNATIKTIAPEQGVVNGWQGEGWGHYFPVDGNIGDTLGSDFDILVIPGGEHGITKLKTNPHTRRIINHFVDAGKPVAAIGAGVELLVLANAITGYTCAAPEAIQGALDAANIGISEDTYVLDRNILTATGTDVGQWVEQALELFSASDVIRLAA